MPLTSRHCFKMVLFVLFISTLNASGTGLYHAQSQKESLLPIRPGEPGKAPFWNQYAKRFIHAPAFDFSELDGAATYRFIASSSAGFRDFTFTADEPWSDLTPIWGELPVGPVLLRVHGLDAQNNVLGQTLSPRCLQKSLPMVLGKFIELVQRDTYERVACQP